MSREAKHLAVMDGLTITLGDDGVWFNFSYGMSHTSINMSNYAKEDKTGMSNGLLKWLVDLDHSERPVDTHATTD